MDDYQMKYFHLEKEFQDYKLAKEKEIEYLQKELDNLKGDLSDITQIKLDKILKTQQLYHSEILLRLSSKDLNDSIHKQMCDEFLHSTPNKKRKTTEESQNTFEYHK